MKTPATKALLALRRNGNRKFLFTVFTLLTSTALSVATTYYVDGTNGNNSWNGLAPAWNGSSGPKLTIQAAVSAASSNDTVRVASGNYTGTNNIGVGVNKALTIESAAGASTTIIDCNRQGGAFAVTAGPTTIAGFTFVNGDVQNGAVNIDSDGLEPVNILDCNFITNYNRGIDTRSRPAVISNCWFYGNSGPSVLRAYVGSPGPGQAYHGALTVRKCSFQENTSLYTGAIFAQSLPVEITDSSFISNRCVDVAYAWGGAIYIQEYYGGLNAPTFDVGISNCVFVSNSATNGSAIYYYGDHALRLDNCLIASGVAGNRGAIYGVGGSQKFVNCTFSGNSAAEYAVLFNEYDSGAAFTNCIVWGNQSGNTNDIQVQGTVSYSDIQGGWTGSGSNNISADPLFVDPVAGDFHLKSRAGHWTTNGWVIDSITSPCIDAGDPTFDYSNEPAPNGGRVNMGYYGNTAQASKSPLPPVITSQPQSQYVAPASNFTLTVAADGTEPLIYQWRFNGTNISGATSTAYTKTNAQSTDTGSYFVVVTNDSGSATSSVAMLLVIPPDASATVSHPGFSMVGQFYLTVAGAVGYNYAVEASSNLTLGNWISLRTNVSPFSFTDAVSVLYTQRYYRAVIVP